MCVSYNDKASFLNTALDFGSALQTTDSLWSIPKTTIPIQNNLYWFFELTVTAIIKHNFPYTILSD